MATERLDPDRPAAARAAAAPPEAARKQLTPAEAAAFHQEVTVELISERHREAIEAFECHEVIDHFLKRDALQWCKEGLSKPWLFVHRGRIVGYVTLSLTVILLDQEERDGLAVVTERKEWPAVLIGMLGVDKDYQGGGRRLGDYLLRYAVGQAELIADIAGAKFIVADVYNEPHATEMYERNGFRRSSYKDYQGKARIKYWRALTSNPPADDVSG